MFKKKRWQYLMIATMVLSSLGPIGSVAAAEAMAPEPSIEMAQDPALADQTTQDQVTDNVTDETPAPTETTPTLPEEVETTPDVQQPETETPIVDQPQTETPVVDESPSVEEQAVIEEAAPTNTVEEVQDEPVDEEGQLSIDTPSTIMFSDPYSDMKENSGLDLTNSFYNATAVFEDGAKEKKIEWSNDGEKLFSILDDDKQSTRYYVHHKDFAPDYVNQGFDIAGLYVNNLKVTSGKLSATKTITVGGLRGHSIKHEDMMHKGMSFTMEAAASLPQGHSWDFQWDAMHTNSAGNTSNIVTDFHNYRGVENRSGETGMNPTDADFALKIAPTSDFVEILAKETFDHKPIAFRLKVTSQQDPTISFYTNYAMFHVTNYIQGNLELVSVPQMETPITYTGDEIRADLAQDRVLDGNLLVVDKRYNPLDGEGVPFDRWHLSAQVSRFTKNDDPSTSLKFNYDLTTQEVETDGSRTRNVPENYFSKELSSEATDPTNMLTANENFATHKSKLHVNFKPFENTGRISTGDYSSTITWVLTPAAESDSL